MKKAGIIGGIGPASTLDYYNGIIEGYRAKKNDGQYPEIVIESVNMTKMLGFCENKDWDGLVNMLLHIIENLQNAGAEFAAIASNTPHYVFNLLKKESPLPLVSIVEATCEFAKLRGCKKVIILGTKFTMNNGLYTDIFPSYGIEAFVPDTKEIEQVQSIIFPKLEDGIVVAEDKIKLLKLTDKLIKEKQADAVVLGCTELPLMVKDGDLQVLVLNTVKIHVDAIIKYMLQ